MNKTQSVVTFGLAMSTLLASAPAIAGGFAVARFGGERGHAASDHITSIYYNPAGLALGDGIRIYAEGTLAFRSVDYSRDVNAIDNPGTGTPDALIETNSGKNELRNWVASPFLGGAIEIIDGLSFGAGFYVPYGGQAKWGQVDRFANNQQSPGALDGSQRWASIEGSQRAVYLTAALAWRSPGGRVAIGAGFNYIQNSLDLTRARNLDGSDDIVFGSGSAMGELSEGRSLLQVSGATPGASIGAMVHVTPCFRVGASYQSQPNFGQMELEGELTNRFGASTVFEPLPVKLEQELPDQVRIAAEWNAFHRGSLRFGVDYVRWSTFEDQCLIETTSGVGKCALNPDGSIDTANGGADVLVYIPRDWKDNFQLRAGGSYFPTDALELNGGLSFDSNAVPDETLETALIDANKVIGTIGTVYDMGMISIEGTLGGVYYQSRTTDPRPDVPVLQRPGRNPDMAGDYDQFVVYGLLGVGVEL